MSNTHLDRAKILTEALPYIQRYNGKIVVVNCGGVAMDAEPARCGSHRYYDAPSGGH